MAVGARVTSRPCERRAVKPERGAALVEFALVSLVFYLLFAATIDFGRMMFAAQALQDVARLAAREIATAPAGANITFEDALTCTPPPIPDPDEPCQVDLAARIYDPGLLAIDITAMDDAALDAYVAGLPIVNRALRPLMIVEHIGDTTLLRYPGALLDDPTSPSGYTVGIPRVVSRGEDGVETIEWVGVLEEVRAEPGCPARGPFPLSYPALRDPDEATPDRCGELPDDPLAAQQRGVVSVRLNYPFQAATLSAFTPDPVDPFAPNAGASIVANDGGVAGPDPTRGTLMPESDAVGTFAGPYGLGRQLAFGRSVRPYRRLLSAAAAYRREVFQ